MAEKWCVYALKMLVCFSFFFLFSPPPPTSEVLSCHFIVLVDLYIYSHYIFCSLAAWCFLFYCCLLVHNFWLMLAYCSASLTACSIDCWLIDNSFITIAHQHSLVRTKYGNGSFSIPGLQIWKTLPPELRSRDIAIYTFRNDLVLDSSCIEVDALDFTPTPLRSI